MAAFAFTSFFPRSFSTSNCFICNKRFIPTCAANRTKKPARRNPRKRNRSSSSPTSRNQNSSTSFSLTENSESPIDAKLPKSNPSKDYIPRGPTLRQQWEDTGRISPDPTDPNAGVLPEVVSQRMFRRLLILGGIPFGLFLAFFAAYAILAFRFEIRVLPSVVAYSTLGTVGLAAFGLTYGIFSASWDPEREGSVVGWSEAKANALRAYDGLKVAFAKEKRNRK